MDRDYTENMVNNDHPDTPVSDETVVNEETVVSEETVVTEESGAKEESAVQTEESVALVWTFLGKGVFNLTRG